MTTLKALKGYTLIEYVAPPAYQEIAGGFFVPSEIVTREFIRQKGKKTFDVNDKLPDIYRKGTVVSSKAVQEGCVVYFNKHDADFFEFEGKSYYRIWDANILCAEEC